MTESAPWSTVRVFLVPSSRQQRIEREDLADLHDRMEALAGMLAARDDVGGVETRDATTLGGTEWPELCVYCTPEEVEPLCEAVTSLAGALGLGVATTSQTHVDDSWRDAWREFYSAQRYGSPPSLLIRPSWIAREASDPSTEIVLDPGRAFGTGLHESTRLLLEVLANLSARGRLAGGARVLDLGCGSGILGLASLALIPDSTLVAVDFDAEAVATSKENAELNGLLNRCEFKVGTADDLGDQRFDLVLANIRPEVLIPDARPISRLSGHILLLSGILVEEGDDVLEAYLAQGQEFAEIERPELHGWCSVVMERKPA